MSALFEWSRDKGAQAVELGAFASNERAIAFYQSLGFAPTLITMEHVLQPLE
jgi:ribosomal protein S18 acetylase RimI-like enzyme